jgi:filamentous hemagglutinin family protein
LLHSVSVSALVVAAAAAPRAAEANGFRSLNQALALAGKAAQQALAPSNGVTASQQAALGAQNVANAANRFRSLADALNNLSANPGAPSPIVVDGYGPGTGLQSAPGAVAGNSLWQGAALPTTKTTSAGITVTVTQNQPLAQLTWQTFNVGAKTTLNFDQSAGGTLASSWVVINTVQDPLANASQILGSINAPGKVYVLNRNGIAFTRGATINVGSLIAATSDIAATQFTTSLSGQTSFDLYGAQTVGTDPVSGVATYYQPTFVNGTAASITVAPGAVIQTTAPTGTNGGGYVMLLGGNVSNGGIISTPLGQTVLAAGTAFTLRQGTTGSTTAGNVLSTTLGSEVAATNYGTNAAGQLTIDPTTGVYNTGSVTNSGVIVADQGDISLVGHALVQSGVLLSTTTVDQRGTIHFLTPDDGSDLSASVTLAPGSVTEILPEDNGETALDSQRATDISTSQTLNGLRANLVTATGEIGSATSPVLNNTNTLADQIEESRVEISTGGSVDVGSGALVLAQGGQIAVNGGSKILLENGANLDVSGTTNSVVSGNVNAFNLNLGSNNGTPTALSTSVLDLLVNVEPFQTRDSPTNRTGALKGTNVYIDLASLVEISSGAYAGNIYTAGGLLEVGGYLGLVPHSIGEWSAIGGQVTLQAQQTVITPPASATGTATYSRVAGEVITDPGSVINLQGGTVSYTASLIPQTYVQAADGAVYNINDAPGNLVYTGLYVGDQVTYARWKTTFDYVNPLLTPAVVAMPAYTVGRDAGSITVNAQTSVIQGAIDAGVTVGQYQAGVRPASVTDPYLLAQTVVPQAGSLFVGNYLTSVLQTYTTPTQVVFQSSQGPTTPVQGTAIFDAPQLNADGFANIVLSTGGNITVNSALSVANGGTVSLTGANVTVNADITARSGAIVLTDQLSSTPGPVAPHTTLTLASGAVLDTRGVWTNEIINPSQAASAAYANGGRVTIAGSNGVTLQAGSRIDVSSGGGLLSNGQTLTGRGGSVSITADIPNVAGGAGQAFQIAVVSSTIVGYGSNGGGTLSLAVPLVQIGGTPASALTTVLDPSLFSTGFSKYVVDGVIGLTVAPGTQVTVAEPIYELTQGLALPTGSDPSAAYGIGLPLLYSPTKGTDQITERQGASISLFSAEGGNTGLFPNLSAGAGGGAISIGHGASISVDPGQSITVAGFGQVTVSGSLTAHGGSVTVANTNFLVDQQIVTPGTYTASTYQPGQSVWLDSGSLIDVSGQAVVMTDLLGRTFGIATSGGAITLGSLEPSLPTLAQVIVRPGAVLDADGAQAAVDVVLGTDAPTLVPRSTPVTLVGNGGSVAADSITGVALDGTVTARAGGIGAAGGTLALTLDPSNLSQYDNIPTAVYQPQEIVVTQSTVATQPATGLAPGQASPADTYGLIRVSQAQIDDGGFASLDLAAQTAAIVFDGNVALHTSRSIVLSSGVIGGSSSSGSVSIAAPYVDLAGETTENILTNPPSLPASPSTAVLTITADLIDQSGSVFLGGSTIVSLPHELSGTPAPGFGPPGQIVASTAQGFGQVNIDSTGDIRFLGSDNRSAGIGTLASIGNIAFDAAQLYPVSGQASEVIAGATPQGGSTLPATSGGTITIHGTGTTPQAPYSVGGSLTFVADQIEQGGIVRAPEGTIAFTDGFTGNGTVYPSQVVFAAGSVTSVSLYGQMVPYGGTVDGVTYTAPGGGSPVLFQPTISVQAQAVDVLDGATIDLRGGGTLTGAGFVFGRGGTADVLTTPLLDISGGAAVANSQAQVAAIQPVRTNDPVYAILPGYQSSYAPAAGPGDTAYTATQIGEQVTVGANTVAGLAAGTYTLLPAYYALLPGAFRVELTTATLPPGISLPQGNYTTAAPVSLSVANTTIANPVPTEALFTSGINVRQLSQYDEETYNTFEASSATQFGAPRPFLPEDAKTLELTYPTAIGTQTALAFAPSALLDAAATGGYGATLEIGFTDTTGVNTISVTGRPAQPVVYPGAQLLLQAGTLDALDFPRLILGGLLTQDSRAVDTQDLIASAGAVYILSGATVSAGDVMVTTLAGGTIDVSQGATISTIGAGPAAFDNTEGFFINNEVFTGQAIPVLDVSNGRVVFTPNTDSAPGSSIVINNGAGLLAGGSLDIVAPNGAVVTIGTANIGAKYASIAAAAINIGSQSALDTYAGDLPQGFDVTPAALTALLTGSATLGTPAASVLTLTATQEVNILGSVALNSGTTDLVLNTPAIYGVGAATDTASITAPQFTWSGVQSQFTNQLGNLQDSSATPGGQIAAGLAGHAIGQLSITAGTIVLGYGPQTQPNDQLVLQRDIAGFDNVTLAGTSEITANNQSGLTVYANQQQVNAAGSGGNLNLVSPLITSDDGAVLNLAAGGAVNLQAPVGVAPAATANVATLGGEISIVSSTTEVSTAVALHGGQFNITAQSGIDVASAASIDLSGAAVHLIDQTAYAPGGTLAFESTTGSITLDTGSRINMSATGTSAGSVSFNALAGGVAVDGTLLGSANAGQTGGSFTVIAGTLATSTQASNVAAGGSAFDNINAGLNAGGFNGSRDFELGTDIGPGGVARTDLVIDNDTHGASLLAASAVTVTTDLGSLDVTGIINASGIGPGSIALFAANNLTLETTAVLDAHAARTAVDSYGNPIDAENRAHVTLTSTAGSLTLNGGTINLTYPDYNTSLGTPQGQLVLNAPRVGGATGGDVAIDARAPINIEGAQSIALYAWTTYQAQDANGTILQSSNSTNVVSLDAINQDSVAFMAAAGTNTALAQRLAGLIPYGANFHLRPGVEIDSNAASDGNLTIGGDLDLSAYRYSDIGYGTQVNSAVYGSGEAGAILFRAKNDLTVNGSVTDGFEPPPDKSPSLHLLADSSWIFLSPATGYNGSPGASSPLSSDVILPASITVKEASGLVVHRIELAAGTTFDETRSISLNYAINILAASVRANTVMPFAATVDPNSAGITIPQGGFVTTAKITLASGQVIPAGTFLAGGTVIAPGSVLAAGSVFPTDVPVADGTVVPAGTLLSIFDDSNSTLTLNANTALLPVNALIPSNTVPLFMTSDGTPVGKLELRPLGMDNAGQPTQGYLYALSAMLPAGSESWNLDFVAGANQASADPNAVAPHSVLNGGAQVAAANTANQQNGSLILDDEHYITDPYNPQAANPAFSVIRTGTGDLTLVAGGNFDQSSLFGIYTAGTQDPLAGGVAANAAYDLGRENYNGTSGRPGVVPGGPAATINRIISQTYQANYPTDGGDVLLSAQGSVTGDVYGGTGVTGTLLPSDAVGNWLWRQGSTQLGQPSAWWINFGTFVIPYLASESGYINGTVTPQLVGFQGIGALGGGNVTVIAGENAGQTTDRQGNNAVSGQLRGEGLVVAIGSTGREISTGGTQSVLQTGGGHLTIQIAGTLNPLDAEAYGTAGGQSDVNGLVLNLRGTIDVTAGAVGRLDETYSSIGLVNEPDPRPINPYTAQLTASDGITIMPGDATVDITTQRDLVLDGVGDPGRVNEQNLTLLPQAQVGPALSTAGGATGFTLWTADTAVSLFSAGGNAAPITNNSAPLAQQVNITNDGPTDDRFVYPSQLYVTAATGNITWGAGSDVSGNPNVYSLELAPSVNEQVAFLAGRSIQGNGMAIDLSGANPAGLSTPLDPAFTSFASVQSVALTNILPSGGTQQSVNALFALEADTPTGNYLGARALATPALFYAANGDILDLVTGETLTFNSTAQETLAQWYLAAKPVRIIASNDIVASGTRPAGAAGALQQNVQSTPDGFSTASGDLFLNNSAASISVVSAGRDILSGYFYVGGPGLLEVDAGRNIQQIGYSVTAGSSTVQLLDYGSIKSLGSLFSGAPISLTGGASIDVSAGLGSGADYTAFADLYLNPANQANLALQITDPANAGKVQEVYSSQLLTWLQQNYGYTGTQPGALAFFLNPANVPVANQDAFLRNIFYAELLASGQQYNDPNSRFHLSYTRGRQAIDALFPGTNGQTSKDGTPAGYTGDITMASGTIAPTAVAPTSGLFDAGVATEHGGDIDVLAPGGQVVLGTTGATFPGGGTGLITNGSGNIEVFSNGSVLLGKSRIFTNAGGNIQIWSAAGDINAGIGARTSVVYNPPVISYDNAGGIVESPAIPTSGSGIATNQPLPSVPVGNIDLTAPLGTIDAGEAGVRSSGNLNLAASRLANTAGFSAGGKTTGNSAAPSFSLGAAEAAGAAAGASQAAGQNLNARSDNQLPSVIEVEVISVSGESEEERRKKRGM